MESLIALLAFLATFGFLVAIHEGAHFVAARRTGMTVEEFSLGFGPCVFSRTYPSGLVFRIGLLPLGGYVKTAQGIGPGSWEGSPWWARAIMAAAGPLANAVAAFGILLAITLHTGVPSGSVEVNEAKPGLPAAAAGMQVGDRILSVNGNPVTLVNEFSSLVRGSTTPEIEIVVERQGASVPLSITPIMKDGRRHLGIGFQNTLRAASFAEAIVYTAERTGDLAKGMIAGLQRIVTTGDVQQLSGPVKTADLAGKAFSQSLIQALWFVGMVSLNLAIINMLPLPGLDGWHVSCALIRGITGRGLGRRGLMVANVAAVAVIVSLLTTSVLSDVLRYFGGVWN